MDLLLVVLDLFISISLIAIILIQKSEGGGLGVGKGTGGMGSFMASRGAATLLTRTTAVLAIIFMGLALLLAFMNRPTPTALEKSLSAPQPSASSKSVPNGKVAHHGAASLGATTNTIAPQQGSTNSPASSPSSSPTN